MRMACLSGRDNRPRALSDMPVRDPRHRRHLGCPDYLGLHRQPAFAAIDECVAAAEAARWQQGYYGTMRKRVDGLIGGQPVDWNGVYVAKEK
jgi:hypothetical protein